MLKWRALFAAMVTTVAVVIGSNVVHAASLKEEIAPTGKLRVAIALSSAGGAFWCAKVGNGYAGVPVDFGKAMADQLGVPVEFVEYQNSGQITDAASQGGWDVTFMPKDPERESKLSFGPVYQVADATYMVRAGSTITNFASLDQDGTEIAAIDNTVTMRAAKAHLKKAHLTAFQTLDEIVLLMKAGELDGFALPRDQLNVIVKQIPGAKVLSEGFRKNLTAVAVPLKHPQSLAFVTKFMTDAQPNGLLRKIYDSNGMKDTPILTQ